MPNGNTDVQWARVPGFENCSPAFLDKVHTIALDLGLNPNFLMAVMSFETGATFSPSIKSAAGSGATGLIQFMPRTATGLGTSIDALEAMTAEEQLDFVAKHFKPFKSKLKTLDDTYMAVLLPAAVGKGSSHVLFKKPSTAYTQNRGLDLDGDGQITVGDATDRVRKHLGGVALVQAELLRRGSQGPEVETLQDELVDLGHLLPTEKATGPGVFGGRTEGALKAFQRDNFLAQTGVYDVPTQEAIRQINEGVRRGARGNVVRGMQERLVTLGYMTAAEVMTGPGIFGPKTEIALMTCQKNHGIAQSGTLTDETYKALLTSAPVIGPAPTPISSTSVETVLPESGLGFVTYNREPGGSDQFGRASTIRAIEALGEAWANRHPAQPFAVGDISRRRGGPFPPHRTHVNGRDVDFRPLTVDGANVPVTIQSANYSHPLTREFVLLVRALFPGATVLFNDPRLVSAGLTRRVGGHDNHLHVSFPA
jgi:peptidoglycan hydrolase-like protein with peptidoglycan-binding domain